MFQYRVTKYDPRFRDVFGTFTGDDWSSVGDIGAKFGGRVLTPDQYLRVENAYVSSAIAFLTEVGVESLVIAGLENHGGFSCSSLMLQNTQVCDLLTCADITRLNLRSEIWCRLESESAFLHFGYDYYMYVGVASECPNAIQQANDSGLFVELFESPLRPS